MNNQRKWAIVMSIAFAALTVKSQESYAAAPSWFQGKLQACKASIPGPLTYEVKFCIQHSAFECVQHNTRNVIIDDSMNQYTIKNSKDPNTDLTKNLNADQADLLNPGLGKCCVFDNDGNILQAHTRYNKERAPSPVQQGNGECAALMSQTPNAKHYGIWWFVKDNEGYNLDWWSGSR